MISSLEHFFTFGLRLDDKYPNERQYGARQALIVLTSINLLNFADRYVPSAVKQLIIDDLGISDFESSLPTTSMIVTYMIFAMIFGYLSDRQLMDRRVILWGAAIFWSIATSLAGLSSNLLQLIMIRAMVGVGEAAYGTISPPLLSDYYPAHERQVVYGIYYLAIPIGGAIGYAFGAIIGAAYGWRIAFVACGVPGIFAAIMILRINDPMRGINDQHNNNEYEYDENHHHSQRQDDISHHSDDNLLHQPLTQSSSSDIKSKKVTSSSSSLAKSWKEEMYVTYQEIIIIMKNQYFMLATGGLVASNFALGGLADWMATYLLRYDNISLGAAGLVVGAATIVGGIGGTVLGSKVCAYFQPTRPTAGYLIPCLFTIPAAICLLFAVNISTAPDGSFAIIVLLLIVGEICVWTYLAPISAISVSCIPPPLRARSCGLQIFLQHILGDIISPPIIGAISDSTGSLRTGLQLTWIMVLVSGGFWYAGSRLTPLKLHHHDDDSDSSNQIASSSSSSKADPKYLDLLRQEEDFVLVNGLVTRKLSSSSSRTSQQHHHDDDRVIVNPLVGTSIDHIESIQSN